MMNKNKAKLPKTYLRMIEKLLAQMKIDRPRFPLVQLRKGHNLPQSL